jgi:hypothetical protein
MKRLVFLALLLMPGLALAASAPPTVTQILTQAKASGGEIAPDNSPAARKADATLACQTARAWWFPKRWPGKIKSLGTHKDGGKTFLVLRITPRGGNPFELWINAKTHLIARTVDRSRAVPATIYFSDHRKAKGIKLPFHRLQSNGKKKYDTVIQVKNGCRELSGERQGLCHAPAKAERFFLH